MTWFVYTDRGSTHVFFLQKNTQLQSGFLIGLQQHTHTHHPLPILHNGFPSQPPDASLFFPILLLPCVKFMQFLVFVSLYACFYICKIYFFNKFFPAREGRNYNRRSRDTKHGMQTACMAVILGWLNVGDIWCVLKVCRIFTRQKYIHSNDIVQKKLTTYFFSRLRMPLMSI